ncbi:GtrA family protein [Brucella sp. BO2]|uniref:GtrA family protein n=1 Tax=Brucella sp. BO2 TaxID=693750 RepID=UPI00352CCF55
MISYGYGYAVSTTFGFSFGLIVNYLFQMKITFRSHHSIWVMFKFFVGVIANYIITLAVVAFSVYLMDNALVGKLLSLPMVAINGFLLSRYWIFIPSLSRLE